MRHLKLTNSNLKSISTERLYKRLFDIKELNSLIRKELRNRNKEIERVVK